MKRNMKRYVSIFLALLLIVTSATLPDKNVKQVNAAASQEESLIHTAGKEKVVAQTGGHTNLGQVANTSSRFTFAMTHPGNKVTGSMKIGLFNTSEGNVWSGGYILTVGAKTESTIDFALRNAIGEGLVAYPGILNVTAGDYMEISTWVDSGTIHITVNGVEIITYSNSDITLGTYMGLYNEWSSAAEFLHVEETTFESIASATGQEMVLANSGGHTNLGQVSSADTKFMFKLTHPGNSISGSMKIGLYNTGVGNVWSGGYILVVGAMTESTVDFALRNAVNESLLAYPGTLNVTAGEYMEISTWIENGILHITVNDTEIITYSGGDITQGNYMGVYNEWSAAAEFSNVEEELIYEQLSVTAGVSSISSTGAGHTNLGELTRTDRGFQFKMTNPGITTAFSAKIGLYNATEGNVWSEGYILNVTNNGEGSAKFELLANTSATGEAGVLTSQTLTGLSGSYVTIATYVKNDIIRVYVNDTLALAVYSGAYGITPGKYIGVYNNVNQEIIFKTLEMEFEELDDTLGKQSVKLGEKETISLGQLGSENNGFSFKVSNPRTANSGCAMKIGLYNTATTNPWADGYILVLTGRATDGVIDIAMRKGNGEALVSYAGEISGFSEEYLTISTWIEANTMHVEINGVEYLTYANDGTVAIGTYMSVYSEWKKPAEFRILGEVSESVPVKHTDIHDTIGAEEKILSVSEYLNMGQLSNVKDYFMFQVSKPEVTQSEQGLKIGLYNTAENNPWEKGYILALNTKSVDGTIGWSVRSMGETDLVGFGDVTDLNGDYITVKVWLTNVSGETEHILHIEIDGREVLTYTNSGSVVWGNYMSAYNEWEQGVTISAMFEDLGTTMKKNSASATQTEYIDMGTLSDMEKGFRFKVKMPSVASSEEAFKVGIYNTSSIDPWSGGYILSLNTKTQGGKVGWNVRGGAETSLQGFGDLTGKYEEYLEVYVWLTKVDEKAGTHVLHIAIDEEEILNYTHDGSFSTGKHLSAYSGWTQEAIVKTFHAPSVEIVINNINSKTTFDTSLDAWKIYFNTDNNILGDMGAEYPWTISIDGDAYATNLVKADDVVANLSYITIGSDKIAKTPQKNHEISIMPMYAETESTNEMYGLILKESYHFFIRTDERVLNVTHTFAPDSEVLGDCDGNGVTESKDLIRTLRYCKGLAMINNQGDLTMADDKTVDEKDARVLRKVLVGLINSENGEYIDNYVALGRPEYDEADAFRIGAYQGPRASGQNDYAVEYKISDQSYDWDLGGWFSKKVKDISAVNGTVVNTSFINNYEFQQYKEAGFNTLISETDAMYVLGADQSANTQYMELAKANDLDVIMLPGNLADYLRSEESASTETLVKEELAALLADYGNYNNFLGIQMADEILRNTWTEERFEDIKKFVQSDLGYENVLLYTLQPRRMLGTEEANANDSLEALIEYYGKTNNLYEYCYYPFEKELQELDSGETDATKFTTDTGYKDDFQQEKWLTYLSQVASTAKDKGVKRTGITLQSCGYEHPSTVKEPSRYDISTKAEVGFQVYTALAYGMKNLTYFTYWEHYNQSATEYFTSSMVQYPTDGSGKSVKTDLYYAVKQVNSEVCAIDHILSDFTWKGTIDINNTVSGDDGAEVGYTISDNYRLASIDTTSSTDQIIIGCMKDSDGFDGYMIADAQNPTTGAGNSTEVTLNFNKATKALVYKDGIEYEIELTNGALTVDLPVGSGIFAIPLV